MKCNRCGGVMLANMESKHKGKDDYYIESCMLCGHDNQPTPTLAELRERDKLQPKRTTMMMADNGAEVERRKGRRPRSGAAESWPNGRIPLILKSGIYDRVVEWLDGREGTTFLAHDIAVELGVTPASAGASLRRAKANGLVQIVGSSYMKAPHKGIVDIWQAVSDSQKQRAS